MLLNETDKKKIMNQLYEYIDLKCLFRCNPNIIYSENAPKGKLPTKYQKRTHAWQFFMRNLTHNPKMMTYVCALFFDDLYTKIKAGETEEHYQLAGLETSSIPVMIAMQAYAARHSILVNSFTVRKEQKPYGMEQIFDGVPNRAPVIIVDDTINSGNSLQYCFHACKNSLGLDIADNAYSIIKYEEKMMQAEFYAKNVNVVGIFSKDDFNLNYDPKKEWSFEERKHTNKY